MPLATLIASFCLSLVAERAVLPVAAPGGQDSCEAILTRIAEVGEGRGYQVEHGAVGLTGRRARVDLKARCAAGHVELELLDGDSATVSVTFGQFPSKGFALEITGRFPAVGTVSRTAILDDAGAEPMAGSLSLAAEFGVNAVLAQIDLGDGIMTFNVDAPGDEVHRINAAFAPALSVSTIWKDAHVLAYAAAGAWDIVKHEPEFDVMLGLAIPVPQAGKTDADSKDSLQKCGTAFVICVAASWLPPAGAWACGAALTTCLAALPCLPADCAGDGV